MCLCSVHSHVICLLMYTHNLFTVYNYCRHKDHPALSSASVCANIRGCKDLSLLESVLVVFDNLVNTVLIFLIQFRQTKVEGHQGSILLHTFLD